MIVGAVTPGAADKSSVRSIYPDAALIRASWRHGERLGLSCIVSQGELSPPGLGSSGSPPAAAWPSIFTNCSRRERANEASGETIALPTDYRRVRREIHPYVRTSPQPSAEASTSSAK